MRAARYAAAVQIHLVDGTYELFRFFHALPPAQNRDGEDISLSTVGVSLDDGQLHPDDRLRIADSVYVAGDPAGPEMHTHLAVYQGEMAARIALGEDVRPDHSAIPHATYTDP